MLLPGGKQRLFTVRNLSYTLYTFRFCYFIVIYLKSQVLVYILTYVETSLRCVYLQFKAEEKTRCVQITTVKITGAELLTIIWLTNGCEK
jgi:hypothetical protein